MTEKEIIEIIKNGDIIGESYRLTNAQLTEVFVRYLISMYKTITEEQLTEIKGDVIEELTENWGIK